MDRPGPVARDRPSPSGRFRLASAYATGSAATSARGARRARSSLRELFTEDASYRAGPYEEPRKGLPAIAELWEAEREGFDEGFTMSSDIVATDGDIAVVRVDVAYDAGRRRASTAISG